MNERMNETVNDLYVDPSTRVYGAYIILYTLCTNIIQYRRFVREFLIFDVPTVEDFNNNCVCAASVRYDIPESRRRLCDATHIIL